MFYELYFFFNFCVFSLQDKDEVADVGSLLTFDLTVSLPQTSCGGLCPVLNDYMPNSYRATVISL